MRQIGKSGKHEKASPSTFGGAASSSTATVPVPPPQPEKAQRAGGAAGGAAGGGAVATLSDNHQSGRQKNKIERFVMPDDMTEKLSEYVSMTYQPPPTKPKQLKLSHGEAFSRLRGDGGHVREFKRSGQ